MSDTATDTTTDMSETETATEDQSIRTKSSKSSKRPSPKQKFSYMVALPKSVFGHPLPSGIPINTENGISAKPPLVPMEKENPIAAGGKGKGRGGPRLRKVDKFTFDDDGKTNTITILSTGTKGDEKDRKYYVHSVDGEGDNTKSEGLSWDEITSEDQSEGLRSKVAERMRERGKEKYMYKDSTTADRKSSTASRSSRNRKGRKARNGKGE